MPQRGLARRPAAVLVLLPTCACGPGSSVTPEGIDLATRAAAALAATAAARAG